MLESLSKWVESNNLRLKELSPSLYKMQGVGCFLLVEDKDVIIDKDMNLILGRDEMAELESTPDIKYILFEFGGRYYYTEFNLDKFEEEECVKAKFNDFKFLGKKKKDLDVKFAHLGVHSEYELLNGSRTAEDWVKKAKFLEHETLAIIDKNTLGGVLAFQLACDKAKIKSIIGETISVAYSTIGGKPETNELILYAKNEEGWQNLLRINKYINIDNDGFIWEKELKECAKGLVAIISRESVVNKVNDLKIAKNYINKYADWFDNVYYQLDSVDFFDDYKYKEQGSSILTYLQNFYKLIPPVLIGDSYYLDEEEAISRIYLNETKKVRQALSHQQHYKTALEHVESFYNAYEINDNKYYEAGATFFEILQEAIANTIEIDKLCNFKIDVGRNKLPKFEYEGDTEELFFKLLQKGLSRKVKKRGKDVDRYIERLEEEASTIVGANFVDYFLIQWDMIKYAKDNGIGVGVGRGSVGGSLIAYLLDITDIDPIEHDLLFERFLNKTRAMPEKHYTVTETLLKPQRVTKYREGQTVKVEGKDVVIDDFYKSDYKKYGVDITIEYVTRPDQNPDIDVDFATAGKDDIKRYLIKKYGSDYVCSVGTYTTSRLKGAVKDFARADGMPFAYANTVTKFMSFPVPGEDDKWETLFSDAMTAPILRKFIQDNPVLVNGIKHILNQAKVPSIHASAVIIVPKDDRGVPMNIYNWMPVRKIKDDEGNIVLISEWEGKYLDKAGFLKQDILGLSQLDKFKFIQDLIKRLRGEEIVLADIPLNDQAVFDVFSGGFTEDVFQMSSNGLKRFCKQVEPDGIEDITAINALWRPGPIGSNAHIDYAEIKHGKKKAVFDYMLKGVTEKTYGLYVYQEQIMKAVNILGGFTLAESDEVRTVMKKFDRVKMANLKEKFIKGAVKNGCQESKAGIIWDKLEKFSGYGFNKSHSAAYGLMAYWCGWFKAHYPEEFYTSSLNYSRDEMDVIAILDEIESRRLKLKIFPPDINKSNIYFNTDIQSSSIYWSLVKIKGLAHKSVSKIIAERKKSSFKSVEDFIKRMNGTGLGPGAARDLITAGAFDIVHNIEEPRQRRELIKSLCKTNKDLELFEKNYPRELFSKNYVWTYEQKALTGFGKVDYKGLLKATGKKLVDLYMNPDDFLSHDQKNTKTCVAGRVVSYKEFNTKRGKGCNITMECNNKMLTVIAWSDVWSAEKDHIEKAKKMNNLLAIVGRLSYDDYRNCNVLYTDESITKVIDL